MRQGTQGRAMAARDAGLRTVTRLTWRAGIAGVICSALAAAAFGHGVRQAPASPRHQGSTIVVPAQPPAPAQGAGQVTSGAS